MDILNIVNSQAMLDYINDNKVDLAGPVVPFNDAMCEGEGTEDIFGSDFAMMRAVALGVGVEEYEEYVISPISSLFSLDYDQIHLYFDQDMFCQINLVTLLGYMDMEGYEGRVVLHIINSEDYTVLRDAEIKVQGFYAVYKDVVLNKKIPSMKLPPMMMENVLRYLMYSEPVNELTTFIKQNPTVEEENLADIISDKFPEYGLGNMQLLKLIDITRMEE